MSVNRNFSLLGIICCLALTGCIQQTKFSPELPRATDQAFGVNKVLDVQFPPYVIITSIPQ